MINEVKFQPIGYIQGNIPDLGAVRIIDSQGEWNALREALRQNSFVPEVDFSNKKIVALSSTLGSPNQWFVVHKIRQASSNVLEIECGSVSPIDGGFSLAVYSKATQFLVIDKSVASNSIKLISVNSKNTAELDPESEQLKIQMKEIADRSMVLYQRSTEKYGFQFYMRCQSLVDPLNIEKIADPEEKEMAKNIVEISREEDVIENAMRERADKISDFIRGPNLNKK